MSHTPLNLSVLIHTKNSESTIARCLSSVSKLDAEVLVMDMGSTDHTLQLAKKTGARILKSDQDYGYVEPARNQAIAAATHDWIFILDADEEITPQAEEKIRQIVQGQSPADLQIDAFWLPRQNYFWKHGMTQTGWWPDFQLRLFKKGSVSWGSEIHAVPQVAGTQGYWPVDTNLAIIHHNYQTIEQFLERLNRYTSQEATQQNQEQTEPALQPAELVKAFRQEWLARLFGHKGVDEGIHGVALSQLQTIYPVVVLLKKWQKNGFPTKGTQTAAATQETITELTTLSSELRYWLADWQVAHSSGLTQLVWKLRRKLRW